MSRDPLPAVGLDSLNEFAKSPTRRRAGRSTAYRWRVSDKLWHLLEPLLEDPARRFRYPGRCRYSARACLEGILNVLFTDTPWLQMPYREPGLPSGETCRRRLEEWSSYGLLEEAITILRWLALRLAQAVIAGVISGGGLEALAFRPVRPSPETVSRWRS